MSSIGKYKGTKITYEKITAFAEKCGCKYMWSEDKFNNEYLNSKTTKMEYKGSCGHTWFGNWQQARRKFDSGKDKVRCPTCSKQKGKWQIYQDEHFNKETGEYKCCDCEMWKNLEENYGKRTNSQMGYRNQCKSCEMTDKRLRLSNWTETEFINKYLLIKAKQRERDRIKRGRNYENKFNITETDIKELKEKQNNKCALSGEELIWKVGSGPDQVSIDRIDSSKTYTRDNIQLTIWMWNCIKLELSNEEIIKRIKRAALFHS